MMKNVNAGLLRLFALFAMTSTVLGVAGRANAGTSKNVLLELLQSRPDLSTVAEALQKTQLDTEFQNGTLFAPTNEAFVSFTDYFLSDCSLIFSNFLELPVNVQQPILKFLFTNEWFTQEKLCEGSQWKFDYLEVYGGQPYHSMDGLNGTIEGHAPWVMASPIKGPNTCISHGSQHWNFTDVTFWLNDDYTYQKTPTSARDMLTAEDIIVIPTELVVVSSRGLQALSTVCPYMDASAPALPPQSA